LSQIHGKFHACSWLISPKLRPILLQVFVEHSELNIAIGELNKHTLKGTYLVNQFNRTKKSPHPQTPFPPLGASAQAKGAAVATRSISFFSIILLLLMQFNSKRKSSIVLLAASFGIFGVVAGLSFTDNNLIFTIFWALSLWQE
jgi:multidrug efflux pump subunit AcrB